jgi:predicted Rossmann fold flavoprotein
MKNGEGSRRRVAVVGGGAGGLAAAAAAAGLGADVTILEKNDRVGKRLLKTGNGRCNLTNRHLSPEGYNHPDFVKPALRRFDCAGLRELFGRLGLWTVSDTEGRVYPYSDSASSVLDVLRLAYSTYGAEERCGFEIVSIDADRGRFTVLERGGERVKADAVVVAAGGGATLLGALGYTTIPFQPALCPIRTETGPIRGLSGLRTRCRATLYENGREIASETGELLFREYGVSGIPAFDLSRRAKPGQVLSLDFTPELTFEELLSDIQKRFTKNLDPVECLAGTFRRRVCEAVWRHASEANPAALCRSIKDFRLPVLGLAETGLAQITRGGADVTQFDSKTLESQYVPGLYAVGEILDIDGRCGGYNLHWAFASGTVAGEQAALGGVRHT